MEHGVQSVMTPGVSMMLMLYVDSWDIIQVRKDYILHCDSPNIGTAFGDAHFGRGTGTIVMDDVQCVGTESYLTNCTHTTNHNCGHDEDAGVRCVCKYYNICALLIVFLCLACTGSKSFFCYNLNCLFCRAKSMFVL